MAPSLNSKLLIFVLVIALTDCILDRSFYEALCTLLSNQKSPSAPLNNKSEKPSENCPKSITLIETHNQDRDSNKSMSVILP